MNEGQSSDHLVLGGLLFLVFSLVVALVFVYTRAGDTTTGESPTTTASINNEAPTVDSINVAYTDNGSHIATSTGLALSLGTTKTVVVWGTISDANGTDATGTLTYGDIADLGVTLYRSGATGGVTCTIDQNDCYRAGTSTPVTGANGQCVISANSGTSAHYACTFALQYFTDSTTAGGEFEAQDWKASVTVTDLSASSDTDSVDQEVNALLALNIPTTIAYGSFSLGASTTAANNQDMTITQKGNVVADVSVSGTAMACSGLGTIPVGNQKWSITDVGYTNGSAVALTGSSVDTDLNVDYQKNENFSGFPSTKVLTWNIGIPTTGVRGTCTGTNTVSVLAH